MRPVDLFFLISCIDQSSDQERKKETGDSLERMKEGGGTAYPCGRFSTYVGSILSCSLPPSDIKPECISAVMASASCRRRCNGVAEAWRNCDRRRWICAAAVLEWLLHLLLFCFFVFVRFCCCCWRAIDCDDNALHRGTLCDLTTTDFTHAGFAYDTARLPIAILLSTWSESLPLNLLLFPGSTSSALYPCWSSFFSRSRRPSSPRQCLLADSNRQFSKPNRSSIHHAHEDKFFLARQAHTVLVSHKINNLVKFFTDCSLWKSSQYPSHELGAVIMHLLAIDIITANLHQQKQQKWAKNFSIPDRVFLQYNKTPQLWKQR